MSRRTDGKAVFFALVSLLVCLAPAIARAQQIVGTVTQLSGSAQIQRSGVTVSAAQGTSIELHDQLVTSPNSSATVTLTSGITLTLAENTNLTFEQNVTTAGAFRNTRLDLAEGGMRSIVPLLGGRPQSFEIHTPNAITAVRGTDFDTTYIEGTVRPGYQGCQRYTDVRVREGLVAVSNLANPTEVVEVGAGYETTVPCLLPPLNAGPLGIAGAAAPGGAGGGRSGAGGGAAAAAVGFSAPPPAAGSG